MPPRRWVAPRSRCCSWDRRWPPSLAPASAAGLRCGPAAPRPARSSSSSPPDAARPPRHLIRCTNLRRGTCLCCRMSTTLTRGQSCRPLFVNTDLSQACADAAKYYMQGYSEQKYKEFSKVVNIGMM
ncbi:uncharacterized protein [Miscanthus floridulus]|uniref:uncharacterized protein isoform X3 n=1 Tax=Miscanthus floridulus TaxID=154761 RepID=UPI00345A18EB